MTMPVDPAVDVKLTALAVRGGGVSILPIDHRTKRPLVRLLPRDANDKPTWRPFQANIADAATIGGWFDNGAKSYAVIGGAISGGLLIIDFDVARFYEVWKTAVGELA